MRRQETSGCADTAQDVRDLDQQSGSEIADQSLAALIDLDPHGSLF
jgi:hypothetical protein